MKQIQSSGYGCGTLLITLGVVGILSTVFDVENSNRAIFQLFMLLADLFGSVTAFSIVTIGVGLIIILAIMLLSDQGNN